jgi:hypothetical protein
LQEEEGLVRTLWALAFLRRQDDLQAVIGGESDWTRYGLAGL